MLQLISVGQFHQAEGASVELLELGRDAPFRWPDTIRPQVAIEAGTERLAPSTNIFPLWPCVFPFAKNRAKLPSTERGK